MYGSEDELYNYLEQYNLEDSIEAETSMDMSEDLHQSN